MCADHFRSHRFGLTRRPVLRSPTRGQPRRKDHVGGHQDTYKGLRRRDVPRVSKVFQSLPLAWNAFQYLPEGLVDLGDTLLESWNAPATSKVTGGPSQYSVESSVARLGHKAGLAMPSRPAGIPWAVTIPWAGANPWVVATPWAAAISCVAPISWVVAIPWTLVGEHFREALEERLFVR